MDLQNMTAPQQIPMDRLGEQEEKLAYNRKDRDEKIRQSIHSVFRVFIWTAGLSLLALFLIKVIHLAIPLRWYWLSTVQLGGIEKIIYSGAVGAFVGGYMNKFKDG